MTTQYATASYQEIIDLHTTTDKVSVIGIHTPVTDAPYTFLKPFFDAFQRYHYDGMSLALVPAARLPADISQVSYEAGDIPIDPRDLLNPILWHGAHGESLGAVLNQFYDASSGTSDVGREFFDSGEVNRFSTSQIGNSAIYESLYYRALTDNTWKKAHPQQGFRLKGLHPMVYSVGTDRQYLPNYGGTRTSVVPHRGNVPMAPEGEGSLGSVSASGTFGQVGEALGAQGSQGLEDTTTVDDTVYARVAPNNRQQVWMTERLHNLGWLDTRVRTMSSSVISQMVGEEPDDRVNMEVLFEQVEGQQKINYLPRLFMGICLLPPSYKAKQYYRLILNHKFSFRKFRGMSMDGDERGRFGPGRAPSYTNLL